MRPRPRAAVGTPNHAHPSVRVVRDTLTGLALKARIFGRRLAGLAAASAMGETGQTTASCLPLHNFVAPLAKVCEEGEPTCGPIAERPERWAPSSRSIENNEKGIGFLVLKQYTSLVL